jgi:hypothetical protein
MAAIGIVVLYFIYGVLGLLTLLGVRRWYKADSSFKKTLSLLQAGCSMGLLVFMVGRGFYQHSKEENSYIGAYPLTAYPDCLTCILYLMPNKHYEVRQGSVIKQQGPWYYESGGDYWIVHLESDGQLGFGRYAYDYEARKNETQKHVQ